MLAIPVGKVGLKYHKLVGKGSCLAFYTAELESLPGSSRNEAELTSYCPIMLAGFVCNLFVFLGANQLMA